MNNINDILREKFSNTIFDYLTKQNENEYYQKRNWLYYSNDFKTNLFKIEEIKKRNEKIYNFQYHKNFLEKEDDEIIIFNTFTLNPIHNVKLEYEEFIPLEPEEEEERLLKEIKEQNKLITKEFTTLSKQLYRKNINISYIQVKELTKDLNIHIHQVVKMKRIDFKRYCLTVHNLNKRKIFGRIQIKTTHKNILDIYKNQKSEKIKIRKNKFKTYTLHIKKENLEEIEKSGNYVFLEVLNNDKHIINYILKYIKKNHKSFEHIILNKCDIKKINHSKNDYNNIYGFNSSINKKSDLVKLFNKFRYMINKRQIKKSFLKEFGINEGNVLKKFLELIKVNKLIYNREQNYLQFEKRKGSNIEMVYCQFENNFKLEEEKELYFTDNEEIEHLLNEIEELEIYNKVEEIELKYIEILSIIYDFDYNEYILYLSQKEEIEEQTEEIKRVDYSLEYENLYNQLIELKYNNFMIEKDLETIKIIENKLNKLSNIDNDLMCLF